MGPFDLPGAGAAVGVTRDVGRQMLQREVRSSLAERERTSKHGP
jgi:hypothetical protein